MNDKPLSSTSKPPVSISIGTNVFHSGVKVIDVSFPSVVNPEVLTEERDNVTPEVGEIRFQNCYVAFLTIKAKVKASPEDSGREGAGIGWKMVLRRHKLMPSPHAETGAQDWFSFTRKHYLCDLVNVVSLRLILQQPSPVWKNFKVEELKLFRNSPGEKSQPLPSWVMEEEKEKQSKKEIEPDNDHSLLEIDPELGVPDLDVLSSNLQQLWALAEEVSANQTEETLGRYEVDGCYDINLLAYS